MIKYIDYDLDAKLFPDGSIRVLDEKEYLKYLPFQIKKDKNYGKIKIKVIYQNEEKEYFPLDIASMLI